MGVLLGIFLVPGTLYASYFGNGLRFAGDAINLTSSTALKPSSALTFEVWLNIDNYTGGWGGANGYIGGDSSDVGTTDFGASFHFSGTQQILFIIFTNDGTSHSLGSVASLTPGQWTHVAVVFDGVSQKIYINGQLNVSNSFGSTTIKQAIGRNFYIGRLFNVSFPYFYHGIMDEFRVWNVARSQAQIQAGMNTEMMGNESGLVGEWRMNETSGTTAFDSSNSNISGTFSSLTHVASLFAPVDSLPVWLDAADPSNNSTVPPNGTSVQVWSNKTAGTNALINTVARRPIYTTNVINGLPILRFDGVDDQLAINTLPVSGTFTIASVFRTTGGIGSSTQWYNGAGLVDAYTANSANDYGTSVYSNGVINAGTGNPDVTAHSASGFNDGSAHVAEMARNQGNGNVSITMDGGSATSVTGGTQSLNAAGRMIIGSLQTSAQFLAADIGEVWVYSRLLTATEQGQLEFYLANKWGIASALSPGRGGAAAQEIFGGNFTQNSGSTLTMDLGGTTAATQYDQFIVHGTYTMAGTLSVSLFNGFNPASGNVFNLFNFSSQSIPAGSFSMINLPALSTGLIWDLSKLYVSGNISVKNDPSIANSLPVSVSGLQLWLDAGDPFTLSKSGSNVPFWADKSGNSRNAFQATLSKQPTFLANQVGDWGMLSFDGSSDYFVVPLISSSPHSVFIVYKPGVQSAAAHVLFYNGNTSISGWGYFLDGSSVQRDILFGGNVVKVDSTYSANTLEFVDFTWDNVTSAFYRDGASFVVTNPGTGPNAPTGFGMVGANQAGAELFTGSIGEILVYNRALNTSERQSVEKYLDDKWAVSSFRPTRLSGLTVWLDGSDSNQIKLNGSTASTWVDKSPSYNNATQGTAAAQPTYVSSGFNQKSVLQFDGSTDFMSVNASGVFGHSYTAFVLELPSVNKSDNWFFGTVQAATNTNFDMGYRSDGDFSLAQYFNDLDVAAPLFANNKAPNIWTGRLDTSSGHAVYRNSNKLGSNGNTQTIIFCTPEIARMHSTLFYAGKIGEIILYNNALSDAQRLQVEDYLRLKWNLAPNSPYFGPGF